MKPRQSKLMHSQRFVAFVHPASLLFLLRSESTTAAIIINNIYRSPASVSLSCALFCTHLYISSSLSFTTVLNSNCFPHASPLSSS